MDIRPSFMACATGAPLPLEDVAIDARLRDLIAEVDVRQVYRNDETTNIEAVYTFPLPLDAVLLELEVAIGERVLRGTVVEKKAAEAKYENAIADGDSAVMLEEAEPGLYTMNVGNVMAGERVTVRFRYGLALRWSGDAVRFFVPTTVAPRYGASPLAPHQVPETALAVENRFGLTVRVEGLLRDARVECATHPVRGRREADAAIVELAAERAVMDRDFVLTFDAQGGERSYALADADPAGHVVLASFQPRLGGLARPEPHSVKIVVDCSGSMAGDSIRQARRALASILDLLHPADRLNVIAFGSHTQALFTHQEPCTPLNLERARRFCAVLDANLGGTEIGGALERVYQSRTGGELPEDVLLITDGEVGNWKPVVERAIASRHRLFTVGVGAAVAEAFVRTLAARTGGACELVSPNEAMAERITRHFQRMSAPRATSARITWPNGATEQWPESLRHVFDGDTVIAWARFAQRPQGEVVFEVEAGDGRTFRQAVAIAPAGFVCRESDDGPSTLARLAAALRLPELDAARGTKEALAYGLVSRWTNCIVVVERAEGEKAGHLPELRKVKQTLAAGWGGVGSVASARMVDVDRSALFLRASLDSGPEFSACIVGPPSEPGASRPRTTPPASQARDARRWIDYDVESGGTVTRLASRAAELHALVQALNAAPERIGASLSVADLEAWGVPEDLLERIRHNVATGVPEHNAVLHFLVKLAKTSIGDGLAKDVKRAIRAAERAVRGEPAGAGGILATLGLGGRRA